MPTPVFVCRLAKDLQNAIRNHAVRQGMAVGDVVSEALLSRGANLQVQLSTWMETARSGPVFSCRMPAELQTEIRAYACRYHLTVTAVVASAVESFLRLQGGGLDVRPIAQLHQKMSDAWLDLVVIEDLGAA